MNSRVFGMQRAVLVLALVAAAACKEDPTAADAGTPRSLAFELDARSVAVADSFRSFAVLRDALGTPLQGSISVTTCNAGVATVTPASDAPQVRTAFYIKGVAFSATAVCVEAVAAGFKDTMMVTTVPFSLSLTGGPATDTITSGTTATYGFVYKDAKGQTLTGVTNPTFKTADTTIAKPGATAGQVNGRGPGLTVVTATGPGSVSGTKSLTVVPAAFTGTTTSPVQPGAFLIVRRDLAGPVIDGNTAVSIGDIDTKAFPANPDSLRVRIGDVASASTKSFTITGLGPNDVADSGSYIVGTPAAFAGTITPSPVFPGATVWIHKTAADPVFDTTMRAFRATIQGTDTSSLAALTVDTSRVRPDSFKTTISDLAAGGTYLFQFTRLGTNLLAERGSYVLPVGTWGGTLTPNTAGPTDTIVLTKGGGDPQFDSDTRVYLNGVRAFIASFSTDTAAVIIPPLETTDLVNMRISRMGLSQLAVDKSKVFRSTTSLPFDRNDHTNDVFTAPTALTKNGIYYLTLSGGCDNGAVTKGSDDCDDWFTVKNTGGADATVSVRVDWFTGADVDAYLLDDNFDCADEPLTLPNGTTVAGFACNTAASGRNPELGSFIIPAGQTWYLWLNLFDPGSTNATLVKVTISGLP